MDHIDVIDVEKLPVLIIKGPRLYFSEGGGGQCPTTLVAAVAVLLSSC